MPDLPPLPEGFTELSSGHPPLPPGFTEVQPGPTVERLKLKLQGGGSADLAGLPADQIIRALGEDPDVIKQSSLFQKNPELLTKGANYFSPATNKGMQATREDLPTRVSMRMLQRFVEMGQSLAQKGLAGASEVGAVSPANQRYLDLVMRLQRNQARLATGSEGYGAPEFAADLMAPTPGSKLKAASMLGKGALMVGRGVAGAMLQPVDVRATPEGTDLGASITSQAVLGGTGGLVGGLATEGLARGAGRMLGIQRGYNELAQEAQAAGTQPSLIRQQLMKLLGSGKSEDIQGLLPGVNRAGEAEKVAADLRATERAATAASSQRFKDIGKELGGAKSPMYNTRQWIDEIRSDPYFAADKKMQAVVADIENSFLPQRGPDGRMAPALIPAQFETLQRKIGDMRDAAYAAKHGVEPDRVLARAYTIGAVKLKNDLADLAEKQGAGELLKEANQKWIQEVKPFLKHPELRKIINPGPNNLETETVGKWVGQQPERLGEIVKQLSPSGQAAFQQHLVDSIYKTPGVLNEHGAVLPDRFLSELLKREGAYETSFTGKAREQMEGLKKLLSEAHRTGKTLGIGASGLAGAAIGGPFGGAMLGALGGAAAGATKQTGKYAPGEVGSVMAAKVFTDPKYSRILQAANVYKPGSRNMQQLLADFEKIGGSMAGELAGRRDIVGEQP